ncbi:hypothetical protein AB0I10_22265 [Streptomyces sp. NPDC050636]|uniref:hypothetical protein n=1 Tax=Streptomyces sp. NPDC050636 TaxID=3154510 RepID=UPI00341D2C79
MPPIALESPPMLSPKSAETVRATLPAIGAAIGEITPQERLARRRRGRRGRPDR